MSRHNRRPPSPAPDKLAQHRPAALEIAPLVLARRCRHHPHCRGRSLVDAAPTAPGPSRPPRPPHRQRGPPSPRQPPRRERELRRQRGVRRLPCRRLLGVEEFSHPARCSTQPQTPSSATSIMRKFRYDGVESTFFQRDGKYFVRTDGADGKLRFRDQVHLRHLAAATVSDPVPRWPDAGAVYRMGQPPQGAGRPALVPPVSE